MHLNDSGTEADYLYGQECWEMDFNDGLDLGFLREQRKRNLIGKYVIICNGIKSKKLCYLQDRKISKKGFWTNFMSNAIGFKTKQDAEDIIRSLRYNKPRIRLVDNKYNLIAV